MASDSELLLTPGESDALEQLFRAEYPSLVGLARLLLDDRGMAEDIAQEAFVRFHASFRRLREPTKAAAYLRRTVVNLAHLQVRRRIVARRRDPVTSGRPLCGSEAIIESRQAMVTALRSRPRRQQECLVLRYYLDLSEKEIAATLGISAGTVKAHLSRGVEGLRAVSGGLA